jgi:DNA-binding transcriptional MerR regulator
MLLWRRLLIMSQPAVRTIIWERRSLLTDDGGRRVFQQQRKIETIAVDEELLITGVSVSEENQRVLNGGVSAS